MKVVILGSGGFIGSSLVRAHPEWIGVTRQDVDLTNQKQVDDFFKENDDIDWVIHCSVVGGSRLEKDDAGVLYKNLLMFENVARYAKKMIYFSSGAAERDNPPTDPYGFSKWLIEKRIESIPKYYALRIWGCYGEGELPTRFSAICKEKKHVVIPQDRYFDFIDIKDVIKIVERYIIEDIGDKLYNLVYPGEKLLLSQWAKKFGATYKIEDTTQLGEKYVNI